MEVRGKNLKELFALAGRAFFDIMTNIRLIDPKIERPIHVSAPDREMLMVAWLGELLYLFETRHLVFTGFNVQSLSDQELRAKGQGELYDPQKHHLKQIFKAVTFHQLRIWEEKGVWRARIVFDI